MASRYIGINVKIQLKEGGEWVGISNQVHGDVTLEPETEPVDNPSNYLSNLSDATIELTFHLNPLQYWKAMYWLSGGKTPCTN